MIKNYAKDARREGITRTFTNNLQRKQAKMTNDGPFNISTTLKVKRLTFELIVYHE